MLAQNPPRSLLASDSGMGMGLNAGMDFSPSQHVAHPAQAFPQDLQRVDLSGLEAHRQRANGFMQALPLDHSLPLQSSAPPDFKGPGLDAHSYLNPASTSSMPPLVHPSHFVDSSSSPSGHVVNPRVFLPSLTIAEGTANTGLSLMEDLSPPSSSSPSSGSCPQTAVFSRRSDGISGASPKSAPADALLFCRTAATGARQRTAQACEKCRDRKTKCSGVRPTCKRCADRGLTCVWAPETRVRGPSRQPFQRALEPRDVVGDPLLALPVPLSAPGSRESSPFFKEYDTVHSAPAMQTTFPRIVIPSHPLMTDQQKLQSWREGTFRMAAVAKGASALSVMGEPIRPLTSVDDCWYAVEGAKVEIPGRERSGTIRCRKRSNSVSVTRLMRAGDEMQPVSETHVLGTFDSFAFGDEPSVPYHNGESSDDSSPPPLDESQPMSSSETSDSEQTFPLPGFLHSHSEEHELHQPFPSYDAGTLLSAELMKLLNFPDAPSAHASAHDFGFAGAAHENTSSLADQVTPLAMPDHVPNELADDLIAQYLNDDAFDKMHV